MSHRVRGDQYHSLARHLNEAGIGNAFDGVVLVTEGATASREGSLSALVMHSCSLAMLETLCVFTPGTGDPIDDRRCRVHYPRLPLMPHDAAAYLWAARVRVNGDRVKISQPLLVVSAGIPSFMTAPSTPLGHAGDIEGAAERMHYRGNVEALIKDRGKLLWRPQRDGIIVGERFIGFDDPLMAPVVHRVESLQRDLQGCAI